MPVEHRIPVPTHQENDRYNQRRKHQAQNHRSHDIHQSLADGGGTPWSKGVDARPMSQRGMSHAGGMGSGMGRPG